ncbi:arsenate reductase/protein-tyrosine-phosphatase family protein [Geodermatophilus sp. SYSU D00079]
MCTGNICRSPIAERLARARVGAALGAAAGSVHLVSAGTQAMAGRGMEPASARVLQELGGDPTGFRARPLTGAMAVSADLTLAMTRQHRQEVLARAPRALARTFTLREAAGLLPFLPDVPDEDATPGDRARALVRRLAAARARRPGGPDDDVRDPIAQPDTVHRAVGQAVAEALDPVMTWLLVALTGRVPEHR